MSSPADDPLHARLDELLASFDAALGADAAGYRGHVHRVGGLVLAQARGVLTAQEREQLAVALVFHDLAIWLDGTFDYLGPSADRAAEHLRARGHPDWVPRVRRMIDRHHQVRPVRDDALVEALRRADLCDVSLGAVHRGIPSGTWRMLRTRWPVAGFHLRLVQFAVRQTFQHPLRPLPMLRW
ncbi:MAG: hypothetical protein PGN13_11755 [Patulibacter minatonensis]